MLVDANLLLYAVDSSSPWHNSAAMWLEGALSGPRRVGLPWQSLVAFVRIATNPRASEQPLQPAEAVSFIEDWLAADVAWTPVPGDRHAEIFASLLATYDLRANLVSDAHLAALAIEHGLTLYSADTDFARFRELSWVNPIA